MSVRVCILWCVCVVLCSVMHSWRVKFVRVFLNCHLTTGLGAMLKWSFSSKKCLPALTYSTNVASTYASNETMIIIIIIIIIINRFVLHNKFVTSEALRPGSVLVSRERRDFVGRRQHYSCQFWIGIVCYVICLLCWWLFSCLSCEYSAIIQWL